MQAVFPETMAPVDVSGNRHILRLCQAKTLSDRVGDRGEQGGTTDGEYGLAEQHHIVRAKCRLLHVDNGEIGGVS